MGSVIRQLWGSAMSVEVWEGRKASADFPGM